MSLTLARDDAGHIFDPTSGTWLLLSKAIHAEIETLRDSLEAVDGVQHDVTRGRIAALREVLALAEPPALPPGATGGADYGV